MALACPAITKAWRPRTHRTAQQPSANTQPTHCRALTPRAPARARFPGRLLKSSALFPSYRARMDSRRELARRGSTQDHQAVNLRRFPRATDPYPRRPGLLSQKRLLKFGGGISASRCTVDAAVRSGLAHHVCTSPSRHLALPSHGPMASTEVAPPEHLMVRRRSLPARRRLRPLARRYHPVAARRATPRARRC
jgi:hypothetical protein